MKILEYHEVLAGRPQEIHAVTRDNLSEQMAWLEHNGYQVVRLGDWLQARLAGTPWPARKSIAITFDDGYLDNYTNALPILLEHHYPATIFLSTGSIGKTSGWRNGELARTPMLNWDQILEMIHLGIDFGSHTVSHRDLTSLATNEIEAELNRSRQELAERLQQPVNLFSYPYSRCTPAVKRQVGRSGYLGACTYLPFYVGGAGNDLLELQRVGILADDDLAGFREKIRPRPGRYLKWLRYRTRLALAQLRNGRDA